MVFYLARTVHKRAASDELQETHLVVVDEAKHEGGHLGCKDHHDDQEELETRRR